MASYDSKVADGTALKKVATLASQKAKRDEFVNAAALNELNGRVEAVENYVNSDAFITTDYFQNNGKTVQVEVSDPSTSGTSLEFISGITQDKNGVISPSKKTVPDATTSAKGVVQLDSSLSSGSTSKVLPTKTVKDALDLKAPLASPALTGTPTAPTAGAGTNTTQIATTAFVTNAVTAKVKKLADVSGMGSDDNYAYSGAAVSSAISSAISGTTGGFLGEKTVVEMNAYADPKMGDNALVTTTGTITVGTTPCTINTAPADVRWTTDGSWIVVSAGYVRDTKVATANELGLVKLNNADGGVILNSNNQMVVSGWDDKADASALTALTTRVGTAENDIDALQTSDAGKVAKSDAVWTIDDSDDAIIVDDDFMTWMFQA